MEELEGQFSKLSENIRGSVITPAMSPELTPDKIS
jgi:hypothetical protein